MTTANTIHAKSGEKPPANLIDPEKWSDLRPDKSLAHFIPEFEGRDGSAFGASKRLRQVLEALMRGPVVAATGVASQIKPWHFVGISAWTSSASSTRTTRKQSAQNSGSTALTPQFAAFSRRTCDDPEIADQALDARSRPQLHSSLPDCWSLFWGGIVMGNPNTAIRKNKREEIRFTRADYKGHDTVNIRAFHFADHGEMRPGKQGIAFNAALLPDVLEALKALATEGAQ